MSDEIKRYMLKLKKTTKVGEYYYIFDFEKLEDIVFIEGQYGVFMHVDKEIEGRKVRAFSIASSNNEDTFKIATKIVEEPSSFKAEMLKLKPGDYMAYNGSMGSFTLDKEKLGVFIAGGIGITPIRGILNLIKDMNLDLECHLIYSEPREIYPFKEEFDDMENVIGHYISTVRDTKEAIYNTSLKYQNNAIYYLAGSPSFVKSITEQLAENGINNSNMKFDRFNGY